MAPPRPLAVQAKPVAPGRGAKKVPVQLSPPPPHRTFSDTIRQQDVKETCPLCIEDLDETDKDFYPCPCGYQVCLFCYGKLKEKCNGMCPNCRREYGAPVDAPTVRQAAEELALETAAAASSRHANLGHRPSAAGGLHQAGAPLHSTIAHSTTQASRLPPVPKPDASTQQQQQQQRRAQEAQAAAYSKRMDAVAALPTGATWAAGGQTVVGPRHTPLSEIEHTSQQQQQQPPPQPQQHHHAAVDSAAWPSLADSTATATAAPAMQPRQTRHDHSQSFQSMETASSNQSHHLRSASASSASAEGMHSRSSSSQDLQQDLLHSHLPPAYNAAHSVPPHLMDAFATAQVSSTVHGVRHSVNVPLLINTSHVEAHPEASAMRASLQQAVKSGAMSSREAATRLMALLRQAEAEHSGNGSARSLLAAGKLPPGFGPPAQQATAAQPAALYHPAHAQPCTSGVNQQDPSIPRPQLGKFRPIQPPMHSFTGVSGRQQQQQQSFSFAPNGLQQQQQRDCRAYSMWSGLPGLELSAALSEWQAAGMQYQQLAPPPGMPQFHPALGFSAASSPPPGFGAPPSAASPRPYDATPLSSAAGDGNGGAANPLAGLSRPPPPGMTAYRPQL